MATYLFASISCLIIAGTQLFAQQSNIDSLRRLFLSAKEPARQADSYYDWAYALITENPETGMLTADTLIMLAEKANNKKNLSRAAYLRGYAYTLLGKFEEALPFHRKELELALQTDDLELHGKALNSLGNCFHNMTRNDSAIIYLAESARVKEKVGNLKDLASAYANIGNVFSDEKAHDKAIEYLEKALQIRLSLPEGERSAIFTYNNLSVAYGGKGDKDKAIEYAQKGYELAESISNSFLAGVLAGNLSELWLDKGEVEKAIQLANESVQVLDKLGRKANIVYPYTVLSAAWLKKGNPVKALESNQQGYAVMQELGLAEPLAVYYENFANSYEALGDYKQALFWYKKFQVLDDSLFNKEKIAAITEVEAKFETEKKEAQLIRQQLQIERDSTQKRLLLFGSLLAILSLGSFFYYLRNKQRVKQREAELAVQLEHAEAEKLREMDAMKSIFFANISHEFRTPLTLILSPVEQMMSGQFKGDFHKYYRIIHQNGKRLLNLVNQLLDLSKLESGKLKLEASEGDIGRFVAAISGSFESLAVRQQVGLDINIPTQPMKVFFDRDKVEKILANLISNAFKFTGESGAVTVSVLALTGQDMGFTEIKVSDTGMGIPKDQLPSLFERFTKSSASDLQPGSGIGLALTKELAELHGGSLQVDSTEGKGTTFTVRLATGRAFFKDTEIVAALQDQSADKNSIVIPLQPLHESSRLDLDALNKPVLLIAEDNPDVRSYIVDTLYESYKIIVTENGKVALEKALENTPDLIITDIMMPEMDGIEFCRRLKSDEKTSHIPVVMLTAKAEQSDKMEGLEKGADDYLVKPFDVKELQTRLSNLIAQRKRLQKHYRQSISKFASPSVEAESMDAVFLLRVKETIELNLEDDHFSVVELGNKIGMSRSQLHRKLSALTGFSPNEIIRNMRLERARQLLEKKAATVSEVAYMCGFNSPAYFIKCFREFFGFTPGEMS
jgi:signal transduction histidine kinase/DNA-binding response OmpR family regulator